MTTSVLRTADAWWVTTPTGAAKLTTTAELLADRAAITAAGAATPVGPALVLVDAEEPNQSKSSPRCCPRQSSGSRFSTVKRATLNTSTMVMSSRPSWPPTAPSTWAPTHRRQIPR
jgi:hypothetical protein